LTKPLAVNTLLMRLRQDRNILASLVTASQSRSCKLLDSATMLYQLNVRQQVYSVLTNLYTKAVQKRGY